MQGFRAAAGEVRRLVVGRRRLPEGRVLDEASVALGHEALSSARSLTARRNFGNAVDDSQSLSRRFCETIFMEPDIKTR